MTDKQSEPAQDECRPIPDERDQIEAPTMPDLPLPGTWECVRSNARHLQPAATAGGSGEDTGGAKVTPTGCLARRAGLFILFSHLVNLGKILAYLC